ncbi:MAG: phage terminase large subunit [Leptolyngbyaceae bacterium]|nr:phage terminase large subunit [Leptolyngbyaceae bacterium]
MQTKKPQIQLTAELIEGMATSTLMQFMDNASEFGWFHREWLEMCCSDEPFVAIAAPRSHAKSTVITIIYTLAAILFRNRRFVLLVADTEGQASLFLGQIKHILYSSKELQQLFGLPTTEDKGLILEKDTETDVIGKFLDGDRFRIIAKGAEQKLRGLMFDGTRPDLIVIDDLMETELVANKDRREKLRKWMYGSLIPCRAEHGIIRFVGTPMHQSDPLESLMPKESSNNTIVTDLKVSSKKKVGAWVTVKYRAHSRDWTKLLWPERKTIKGFKELRDDFIAQGIPEVYACEYLCDPVDDSIKFFKKTDLHSLTSEDRDKELKYYISGDFAISDKDRADYTVFMVGGMDHDGIIQVKNVIRDRMDGLTIVETMLQLQKIYDPEGFGIEEMQVSKAIGPFLNRAMVESGIYMNVMMLKPHKTDKVSRARSIQARMRAGGVKFDKGADWYPDLEEELLTFPRARHDDQVDALSYLGILLDKMVEGRSKEEIEEDIYDEDAEESELSSKGRSNITGY